MSKRSTLPNDLGQLIPYFASKGAYKPANAKKRRPDNVSGLNLETWRVFTQSCSLEKPLFWFVDVCSVRAGTWRVIDLCHVLVSHFPQNCCQILNVFQADEVSKAKLLTPINIAPRGIVYASLIKQDKSRNSQWNSASNSTQNSSRHTM